MFTKNNRILFAVIFVLFAGVIVITHQLANEIEENGGVRGIVVEAGKGVKSIINEINEGENK